MDYVALKANISNICENTFTESEYALFTQQAEQRIFNTVQLTSLRKNVTGTLTSGNKYLAAPDDFLSVFSIAITLPSGEFRYLINKDVNFIREAYPLPNSLGAPRHYALFGPRSDNPNELSMIVGPTPDASFVTELHYYYYPPSLVTAGTTWLGDNFDSALLNGALVEAIRYMKGEADMVKLYQDMYLQSIALLKNLGDGKQRGDSYRDGQVRIQVN